MLLSFTFAVAFSAAVYAVWLADYPLRRFCGLKALTETSTEAHAHTKLFCMFDSEEIGSQTRAGAKSPTGALGRLSLTLSDFLSLSASTSLWAALFVPSAPDNRPRCLWTAHTTAVSRLVERIAGKRAYSALDRSFFLSADMAHAQHPNYQGKVGHVLCWVVWCRAVLWCGVPFCAVSCAMRCRVVSCHVPCGAVWCRVMCHAVPCGVVWCCAVVWCAVLCRVMCRVVLWCAVLGRVVL
jgi:hypothetical protein